MGGSAACVLTLVSFEDLGCTGAFTLVTFGIWAENPQFDPPDPQIFLGRAERAQKASHGRCQRSGEGRVLCSYAQTHSDLSEHPSEAPRTAAVLS